MRYALSVAFAVGLSAWLLRHPRVAVPALAVVVAALAVARYLP